MNSIVGMGLKNNWGHTKKYFIWNPWKVGWNQHGEHKDLSHSEEIQMAFRWN
jgi:hypothetical protein